MLCDAIVWLSIGVSYNNVDSYDLSSYACTYAYVEKCNQWLKIQIIFDQLKHTIIYVFCV